MSELIDRRDKNVLNNLLFLIHAFFKALVSPEYFIFMLAILGWLCFSGQYLLYIWVKVFKNNHKLD